MTPELFRQLTQELYDRLSIKGVEPFRLSAYERLAKAAESLPDTAFQNSQTLLSALQAYPGIGTGLLTLAQSLYETGTAPLLEELRTEIPETVLEMLHIGGLGPKRVHQIWYDLRIPSPEKLLEAIERGKLSKLKGWGPATLKRIEENVRQYLATRHLLLYYEAALLWESLLKMAGELRGFLYPLGEFRRALPLMERVEGGILFSQWERVASALSSQAAISPEKIELMGGKLVLYPVKDEDLGWALIEKTGPADFVESLRGRLGEKAAWRGLSEEEIFKLAGLPYILPQWRDWEDILLLAEEGRLPEPLELSRIQGTVHVHTTYSDGADTLEAMAEAAQQMGWRYLGIADHSARAAYAGGLSSETLLAQGEAIDALNARYEGAFTLLHGVEADILPEGEIDYDEAIWQKLDYLVASVHEKLQMDRAEATARLLRAVANPYVRVLGHWTGRLLRGRHGYPIDEEAILDACAAHNVAIEFNGNPHRMEIDWRWVRRAAEKGISIVLTTDAHSTRELQYLPYALPVLQKGLLPPHLFLNYQGPEVFKTKSKRV
jgi:DNA polymerase (family 10)